MFPDHSDDVGLSKEKVEVDGRAIGELWTMASGAFMLWNGVAREWFYGTREAALDQIARRSMKKTVAVVDVPTPTNSSTIAPGADLDFVCDDARHLVCVPYSKANLHKMAAALGIARCWFHKDHYDVPKRRVDDVRTKCRVVDSREIVRIVGRRQETMDDCGR